MIASGIYCWHNLENGKRYIGQSSNIAKRKIGHLLLLRKSQHKNQYLQSAWDKYGEVSFSFCILEECNINMMDVREVAWINYFNSANRKYGYNIHLGGGSMMMVSQESRKKMSLAKMGKKLSEEHKMKISLSSKGLKKSDETKKRISNSKRGISKKPFSIEHRKNLALAGLNRMHSESTKQKMRAKAKIREQKRKALRKTNNSTIN